MLKRFYFFPHFVPYLFSRGNVRFVSVFFSQSAHGRIERIKFLPDFLRRAIRGGARKRTPSNLTIYHLLRIFSLNTTRAHAVKSVCGIRTLTPSQPLCFLVFSFLIFLFLLILLFIFNRLALIMNKINILVVLLSAYLVSLNSTFFRL